MRTSHKHKVFKGIISYYNTMERLTIYPEKELMEKIEKEAKKEKRSMNNLVLFILENFFKKKR